MVNRIPKNGRRFDAAGLEITDDELRVHRVSPGTRPEPRRIDAAGARHDSGVGRVAAAANARRNRVAERTSFSNTDIGRLDAKFDVVLANIHYETLCELANELVNCLAPEGWLGLSGISRAQISRLSARFPSINFGDAYYLEDWNALIGSFKIE